MGGNCPHNFSKTAAALLLEHDLTRLEEAPQSPYLKEEEHYKYAVIF